MNKVALKSIVFFTISIFALLFTAGCETPSSKSKQSINLTKESQRANERAEYLASAQHYLKLSETAHAPQKQEYEIMAADMFAKAGQSTQSRSILDKVNESDLDVNLKLEKQLVLADLALSERSPDQALKILSALPSPATMPNNTRSRTLYLQARSFEAKQDYLSAAKVRSELDGYLVDAQSQLINRRSIQDNLAKLPTQTLDRAAHQETYPFSGWLSLAYIDKTQQNVAQKSNAIEEWQRHYPNHPAQAFLPQEFKQAPANYAWQKTNTQKIALLLPLTGPHAQAAKAIREGYFAAYYNAHSGPKPNIQVYDTSAGQDVVQVYQQAVSEGADFIVGPLVKDDVVRLSQMPPYSLRTPILALNEHPGANVNARNFVQFSLSPENEADQITEKARRSGYKNASIIVPDNSWGQRLKARFEANWRRAGGNVVSTATIDPHKDLSAQVRKFLAIEQSESRGHAIKQLIKEKVDYQVRRRSDVDVVFMALPAEQARQVKPLFDFYYANDIPVLATSSVYAGYPNPKRDHDINGIQFVDMPWVVNPTQARHVNNLMKQDNSLQGESRRLFAMGVDAFTLTQQFNQLQQSSYTSISGATGQLKLAPNNRIERTMTWVKISNGSPVIIQ